MNGCTEVLKWNREGDTLVVTVDNPPVNALSQGVRQGLMDAISAAEADRQVKAVLMVGAGSHFIAGADIREFGRPAQPPTLSEVCQRLESCSKIVIAAIQGVALGGGLEVALSAHYRLAMNGASLGLPEVKLGLLPGAGGTQRTPRLIGAGPALDIMLSGRHVGAQEALDMGLLDRIGNDGDARACGLAYAQELIGANAPVRPTRNAQALADQKKSREEIQAASTAIAKKNQGLLSPMKIVEAVSAAISMPFDEGKAIETALFHECLNSPQRAGLVHSFFSERETAKIPEARTVAPRRISNVAVIGGGTMGVGIAVSALNAGFPVIMLERDEQALATGRNRIEAIYARDVSKGRMTQDDRNLILSRFSGSITYRNIADTDLVIEAVFEDLQVKQDVFRELDVVCKPGAILATNTSTLDVNAIAAVTTRPQDVIGLHFFSPAHIMKLLEIVVTEQASADVVAAVFEFAKRIKKIPVRAGVCDGFIGNRILAAYKRAADYLMEDGASPYDIDNAVRAFGFAMGPFQVTDLAGGDIGWAIRKRRAATRSPQERYVGIADRICERGWFGQKTGRGFYLYPEGERSGVPDPDVLAIVDDERLRAGISGRSFSEDEIMERYLAAMVNEGANVVNEGIALRPLDVDVTFTSGYGFPRHKGGPMHWADSVGLDRILENIQRFALEDPQFWAPSPLLIRLVAEGQRFSSLNQQQR